MEREAQSVGYFEAARANLVLACCGFRDELALECVKANLINLEKFKNAPPRTEPPLPPEREKEIVTNEYN